MLSGWPKAKRNLTVLGGFGNALRVGHLDGLPNVRRRLLPDHPLSQSLLHWWPMNEGVGDTLSDLVGPQTRLTINGYSLPSSGRINGPNANGSALLMDGSDDYAPFEVPSHLSAWSVSVWVRPDAWQASSPYERTLIGVYTSNYARIMFGGGGASGNKQRLAIDTGYATYISTVDQTLGAWIHVVGTADAIRLRLYVNGAEIGNGASAATMQNSGTWNIGKLSSYGRFFIGGMAHCRLYSTVLSATAVAQLYADRWAGSIGEA